MHSSTDPYLVIPWGKVHDDIEHVRVVGPKRHHGDSILPPREVAAKMNFAAAIRPHKAGGYSLQKLLVRRRMMLISHLK